MDRNKEIMKHFPDSSSWEERYKKIISLGKELSHFKEEDKKPNLLISSCQSRLWLKAELNKKREVVFTGDSDGLITKGLLAIMITFYSHQRPEDILKLKPEFLKELDFSQYLSLKRTNGLQSLLDQIRNYAKVFSLLSSSNNNLTNSIKKTS